MMMETPTPISGPPSPSPSPSSSVASTTRGDAIDSSRSYGIQLPSLNSIQSPLSLLLEYSGIFSNPTINQPRGDLVNTDLQPPASPTSGAGEVSIQIVGPARGEEVNAQTPMPLHGVEEDDPLTSRSTSNEERSSNSSYHYDVQRIARWFEHVLPFSLLLLLVFIRQHLKDTVVRQAVMAFKCVLLIYYKNGRRHDFRRQGKVLTLVEYTLLLYRALLPTPVWYRFFLNKDYGSLFSSLTTGLYLTFKLTSVIEKVQSFYAALKALSQKEVHYGSYATLEQVNEAGDLCAICQEKMQAPILLRCKHIFCEDCVSEWFERERTCPLCRAVVKAADLRSFGDGSTSLLFQLF
ncbi:RING finger and transmembrane domain-containing protein 2-like isoform X4 [Durio zibethinus]|uniref:RING finger and transmembrane domain-containing protein 2-like isoform X4 n=1 Tax=Durio zibethinus TaxID=66656 RepID=A0A6P5YNJ0_DURZI|nr:RING finger and transmembrane domain-containing protein 2-like isoform X4 [Durio zibethinus]